jgi:hypothetical protein
MRATIIFLSICIISFKIYGQSAYYDRNNLVSVGANLVDYGSFSNSRLCIVKIGDSLFHYTPYEVSSYGFKDGRVYISKNIVVSDTIQRVFLQRLVKGNTTLYYFRGAKNKTFFLEKDSSMFIELPGSKNNFNETLMAITADCPYLNYDLKHVRNTKTSLSKLITSYNICHVKPPPFLKYGLELGYGVSKLIPNSSMEYQYMKNLDFKYVSGFTIGLFADKQISLSDFSLYSGLYYSRYGYSFHQLIEINDIDFVTTVSSLKLPLLIKYTYPSKKFRPFVIAGGSAAYNFKINSSLYEATRNQSIIVIDNNDEKGASFFYQYQLGFAIGYGIEYKFNPKNSLFFELRYNKLYGISDSGALNNSEFNFITGLKL